MPADAACEQQNWDERDTRREKSRVRRGFWPSLKRVAANLPFAEDLLAAYYCALDRATPVQVKGMLFAALAYFVMPFDVFPDLMPLIGFTDDAAVLLITLRLISSNLRPQHREAARDALERLRAERSQPN
jgi:uncharacterized membrane protein YkvA (DUF1232 family)